MRKLIAVLALALGAAACSTGTGPGTGPGAGPGAGPGSSGTPTSSPSPSSSPAASPTVTTTGTTQVTLYYLISAPARLYLAPERHRIAKTQSVARAALEELVHGRAQDPDHSTPFPRAARINSVTIKDKIATVDWSAEVLTASGGSEAESLGIQSVVYTLTQFPSVSKVRFTVEGRDHGTASNGRTIEDFWGHVGLSGQPWDRDPRIEVLEPVTLWTPLDGATSTGTLALVGEASTFESNVGIKLIDASGRVVVQTSTTAAAGPPGRGTYTKTITFAPPRAPQIWTLQAFEASAKDGSIVQMETRTIRVG